MERTITVRGTGSLHQAPDRIEVPITLSFRDRDYAALLDRAEAALIALRAALGRAGFPEEELRTRDLAVNPCWESEPDEKGLYRQVFAGYEYRHGLHLAFDFDLEKLGAALGALAESGAKPEFSVRFTVKDPERTRDALLSEAADDARGKAEALARASGVSLGKLLRVEYGARMPELYSPTNMVLAESAGADRAMRKLSIAPEDITAEDSAQFVWEIV